MRNIDLFDAYLCGELSDSEVVSFEQRLERDLEFNKAFESHKAFVKKIASVSERETLMEIMDEIHRNEFGQPNIVSINSGTKISYLKIASVAAGISLIIFISGILIYQKYSGKKQAINPYQELVNNTVQEINNIKLGMEKLNKKEVAPANMEASGFFISSKGYFITSLHSVKDADSVMVQNESLDYVSAEKVWEGAQLDVAIFKLLSPDDFEINELPINFRREPLELGEKVFAVGYPRETIVYSEGNISAESGLNGDTTKYQLSMLINPGSSGSPVLDESGNLVGIISGRNTSAQGVSYAVKSKYIYDLIEQIPDEKLKNEIQPNGKNSIKKNKRTEQLKKLKPFVFSIKVYKSAY